MVVKPSILACYRRKERKSWTFDSIFLSPPLFPLLACFPYLIVVTCLAVLENNELNLLVKPPVLGIRVEQELGQLVEPLRGSAVESHQHDGRLDLLQSVLVGGIRFQNLVDLGPLVTLFSGEESNGGGNFLVLAVQLNHLFQLTVRNKIGKMSNRIRKKEKKKENKLRLNVSRGEGDAIAVQDVEEVEAIAPGHDNVLGAWMRDHLVALFPRNAGSVEQVRVLVRTEGSSFDHVRLQSLAKMKWGERTGHYL